MSTREPEDKPRHRTIEEVRAALKLADAFVRDARPREASRIICQANIDLDAILLDLLDWSAK